MSNESCDPLEAIYAWCARTGKTVQDWEEQYCEIPTTIQEWIFFKPMVPEEIPERCERCQAPYNFPPPDGETPNLVKTAYLFLGDDPYVLSLCSNCRLELVERLDTFSMEREGTQ